MLAYENRVREQKLRNEVNQAKRENTHYLEQVDKARKMDSMKARKAAKAVNETGADGGTRSVTSKDVEFKQRIPQKGGEAVEVASLKDDVLSKVGVVHATSVYMYSSMLQ